MSTAKKTTEKKVAPKATEKATTPPTKRQPSAAFMKALTPSAALAAVIGAKPMPRTEVVKELWVYIKKHNLQSASDKRMINADAKLKEVFGRPSASMFEMAGLIGKHLS